MITCTITNKNTNEVIARATGNEEIINAVADLIENNDIKVSPAKLMFFASDLQHLLKVGENDVFGDFSVERIK